MNRPTKLEFTDASGKTTALDFPAGKDVMEGFLRYEADATKQCIKAGKLHQIDRNMLIVTVSQQLKKNRSNSPVIDLFP